MNIVLIGNYPPDKQESMERFAQMMLEGFKKANLNTQIWRPIALFGSGSKSTNTGLGKWLGYLDKWVLFPVILFFRAKQSKYRSASFLICDHSNSPYLKFLPQKNTTVTCHDVLAIRGALGFSDAFCDASAFGKVLQKWILNNLSKSSKLAAVSQLTLNQLKEISVPEKPRAAKDWRVIHNAYNNTFRKLSSEEAAPLLKAAGVDQGKPFLLHVGSDLPRKNRKMLLEMVAAADGEFAGNICFAGHPLEQELSDLAESLNLKHRVISIIKPDHQTLLALYSSCYAFVFPSFSEGFGWPIIEAQACGAAVITSTIDPMPEVSGGGAILASPYHINEFKDALLELSSEQKRSDLIYKGFDNARRFHPLKMIASYIDLMKLSA